MHRIQKHPFVSLFLVSATLIACGIFIEAETTGGAFIGVGLVGALAAALTALALDY